MVIKTTQETFSINSVASTVTDNAIALSRGDWKNVKQVDVRATFADPADTPQFQFARKASILTDNQKDQTNAASETVFLHSQMLNNSDTLLPGMNVTTSDMRLLLNLGTQTGTVTVNVYYEFYENI